MTEPFTAQELYAVAINAKDANEQAALLAAARTKALIDIAAELADLNRREWQKRYPDAYE
jgi:hypothetical protein